MKRSSVLIILAIVVAATSIEAAATLRGCSGFVRVSKSLSSKPDLSKVALTLHSKSSGVAKDTTECSPIGSYFLPVYEKGTFTVTVSSTPAGWAFSPVSQDVTVQDDGEHRLADFELIGFAVRGTIKSASPSSASLAKITIQLLSSSSQQTIHPNADGTFEFSAVVPGKYTVVATHPGWTITPSTLAVEVVADTVVIPAPITVTGYSVSGTLSPAIEGVSMLLFSPTHTPTKCTGPITQLPAGVAAASSTDFASLSCGALSAADGRFTLTNVPSGKYLLVPHYHTNEVAYDVAPAQVEIQVVDDVVALESKPFQVVGFSAFGKVVEADGKTPVAGAEILLNGKPTGAVSSAVDGSYRLEKVKSGSYEIKAVKPHTSFVTLSAVMLSPGHTTIQDLKVSHYDLCGQISVDHMPAKLSSKPSAFPRAVVVKGKHTATVMTDASGAFCASVVPGEYEVSVSVSEAEKKAGLKFSARNKEVVVKNSAVLDLQFTQELHSISGSIKTLTDVASCPAGTIKVTMNHVGEHDSTVVVASDCSFEFSKLLPGKCTLSVNHDSWCFEKKTVEIKTDDDDKKEAVFEQTGFTMVVSASHPAELLVTSVDNTAEMTVKVTSTPLTVCLPKPGEYVIKPTSCAFFGHETFLFDTTSASAPMRLQATKFRVGGFITLPTEADMSAISVSVTVGNNKQQTAANIVRGAGKLEFWQWLESGQQAVFVPSSTTSLLFYPEQVTAFVSESKCTDPVSTIIEARPGKYITGHIEPAMADVRVIVSIAGTTTIAAEGVSDASGAFSVGPLRDDKKYEEKFFAPGFVFTRNQDTVTATKMARLTTVAKMAVAGEQKPLAGVVMSISGVDFFSNELTGIDGRYSTGELMPGDFYVRPVLKEYVFKPASRTVSVSAQGEEPVAEFIAERTGFSVHGTVKTLDGMPVAAGLVVTAIPAADGKQEKEQTQTDEAGVYRLRGLVPGHHYTVSILSSKVRSSDPLNRDVFMAAAGDVRDVNFLVFPHATQATAPCCAVTGAVNVTSSDLQVLKSLEVTLTGTDYKKTMSVGVVPFFDFGLLPRGVYQLSLKSTLNTQHWACTATPESPVTVDLTTADNVHTDFTFNCGNKQAIQQQETQAPQAAPTTTSVFSLLFVTLCVVAALNHTKTIEISLNLYQFIKTKMARPPRAPVASPSRTRKNK